MRPPVELEVERLDVVVLSIQLEGARWRAARSFRRATLCNIKIG
jgi:hypothetical protein